MQVFELEQRIAKVAIEKDAEQAKLAEKAVDKEKEESETHHNDLTNPWGLNLNFNNLEKFRFIKI